MHFRIAREILYITGIFAIAVVTARGVDGVVRHLIMASGCWASSRSFIAQFAVLSSDCFAAKRAGDASVARRVLKLHDEVPSSAKGKLLRGPLPPLPLMVRSLHPPARVRLAVLERRSCAAVIPYLLLWAPVFLGCSILPLAAFVAGALGFELPPLIVTASFAAPAIYLCCLHALGLAGKWRAENPNTWKRLDDLLLAGFTISVFCWAILPGSAALIISIGLFAMAWYVVRNCRPALSRTERNISKARLELHEALMQGRTSVGLSIIERALARYPMDRGLAQTRGWLLIDLGRLDEAVTVLEGLNGFGQAEHHLAYAEFERGNLYRAAELMARVLEGIGADGALGLAGLIAFENGQLDAAEEFFLKAGGLDEEEDRNAFAIAGRALVALERGDLALAEEFVRSLPHDFTSGFTLLVKALERKARRDDQGSRESLDKAVEWVRKYPSDRSAWLERLAARKGLSLERSAP